MPVLVPNSASVYASAACIPSSTIKWTWLAFVATPGGSGSMMWFQTASPTSGCELLPMVCASGGMTVGPIGPFSSPCGYFAGSISGGCAVIWIKQSTH